MMSRGFIEARVPYRDGDSLEFRVKAVSEEGFAATGSAYFDLLGRTEMGASIAEFAAGLEVYPIPLDGGIALRGGYYEGIDDPTELITVSLQPFGVGHRGETFIQVRLGEIDWSRPTRRKTRWASEASFRVSVDPGGLPRWASELRCSVDGSVEAARIDAA